MKTGWRKQRGMKAAAAVAATAVAAAYLAWMASGGRFDFRGDGLHLQTGAYHWRYPLTVMTAAQCLGAIAFFWMAVRRSGRAFRGRPQARDFLLIGTAIFWALALAAAQILELTHWDGFWLTMIAGASALAVVVLVRPLPDGGTRLGRLGDAMRRIDGPALRGLGAATALALAVYSWLAIYHRQPLLTDSQSQIAQARLLLTGQWRLEISQALRDVIAFPFATESVPSYSQFPPGHILLLAAAIGAGLWPHAVNALAAAGTALFAAALARRAAGRAAVFPTMALLLGSPFFIGMSGSTMNHVTTALALTGAAWCLMPEKCGELNPRARLRPWLGGLLLGWALMTRPLTALTHGAVWAGLAVWLIARAGRGRGDRARWLKRVAWAAFGAALPAAFFLFYNFKTTGDPFLTAYQVNEPELHRLGFPGEGDAAYAPFDAFVNLSSSFISLNALMFGWAVGSWTLIAVWWARTRFTLGERLALALIVAQTAAYALYQYYDLFLGPRFLYEVLPFAAILAGAGLAPLLRAGGRRAGLTAILIVMLSAAGAAPGFDFWHRRYDSIWPRHRELEAFVESHRPYERPTAIVIREPYHKMTGPFFEPGGARPPVWFVDEAKLESARGLPELQNVQWLYFSAGPGEKREE